MSLSSRLWKFRRYRTWMWAGLLFTIPGGIVACMINVIALILTDTNTIRNIEEYENEKDDSS